MRIAFVLVPIAGYVGLWVLGSVVFLVYFRILRVPVDLKNAVAMIRKVPPIMSILTVPACSFLSFFVCAKLVSRGISVALTGWRLLEIGVVSLLCTVVLDLFITVLGEKIDIRVFPVNLMYLFAWLIIIPAVMLGGR